LRRPIDLEPVSMKIRSFVLAVALAGGSFVAGVTTSAPALAGTPAPIALDAPDLGGPPLMAYDPTSGTTYVAWGDPHDNGSNSELTELCILPSGAAGCEGGTPVILTDAFYSSTNELAGPGGLVVLPGGKVVVIGDTVEFGSIAWESAAGGADFLAAGQGLQNSGHPISATSLFYKAANVAALSDTDVGLLDSYGNFFNDTSLSSASPAPVATDPVTGDETQYQQPYESEGPAIAAEQAPPPAAVGTDIVIGVGENDSALDLTPSGCANYAADGYGLSVGTVNGTSNAAGTLNNAGLPKYALLNCAAEAPVLAQGGSGIGVVDEEGSGVADSSKQGYSIDYRPFIATATGGSFGSKVELSNVTNHVTAGVSSLDLSQDSGTGVYATWTDHQGLVLDYSPNSGATWDGPVIVPQPAKGAISYDAQIAGIGDGNVLLAYDSDTGIGNRTFVQLLNYASLVVPAADAITTVQKSGSTSGTNLSITAGTVGETDRATISGVHATDATGTMSYALYSKDTCSASSKVFNGGSSLVTAGAAAASAPVTAALASGTYYWRASYSGNTGLDGNAANTSTCKSEKLTVSPAATIGATATSTSTTVTFTISCAAACTVTVTLTLPGGASSSIRGLVGHKKKKPVILGKGHYRLGKGKSKHLKLKLTKAGRKLLKKRHGHLKGSLSTVEKIKGHKFSTTRTIKIKHKK
jgi:hypothetical protein